MAVPTGSPRVRHDERLVGHDCQLVQNRGGTGPLDAADDRFEPLPLSVAKVIAPRSPSPLTEHRPSIISSWVRTTRGAEPATATCQRGAAPMSPKRLVRTARYLVVLVLFLDLELSRRREAADLRVTSPGVLGTRRRAVTRDVSRLVGRQPNQTILVRPRECYHRWADGRPRDQRSSPLLGRLSLLSAGAAHPFSPNGDGRHGALGPPSRGSVRTPPPGPTLVLR